MHVALTGAVDDTDGRTARMDQFGGLQRADAKATNRSTSPRQGVLNAATAIVERVSRPARVGDGEMVGTTISVVSKVTLYSGSSQHGKQRRASVDWNWVLAIVSVPSSAVYVDR